MKLITYVVVFLGLVSLFYSLYNMPVWLLKSIFGILGFVASFLICLIIEEKNEKKNQ